MKNTMVEVFLCNGASALFMAAAYEMFRAFLCDTAVANFCTIARLSGTAPRKQILVIYHCPDGTVSRAAAIQLPIIFPGRNPA